MENRLTADEEEIRAQHNTIPSKPSHLRRLFNERDTLPICCGDGEKPIAVTPQNRDYFQISSEAYLFNLEQSQPSNGTQSTTRLLPGRR